MKVFIDTAPLIYLIEGSTEFADRVEVQLSQWINADMILTSSTLTLLELLVIPHKQKNNRLVQKYRALMQDLLSVPMVELNQTIAVSAAEIRGTYGFKTPDSIQLATALHSGSDIFYTNDLRLSKFKEITILTVAG
ncbi:PIN domain-containing protein [Oceanispirochaeta sp.]|uniref:type II toxin-antitoxin system VapC family toxin n=1 Tax=Oceanispirochaeta sp. TaxID=2035350 RepID=UPI00260A12B7|nr:PIN domain-containing protein [Oceanispirochaeta sp.]MDA3956130.1 PIN domain-containing protein [Oceanispirochaeta sp.]